MTTCPILGGVQKFQAEEAVSTGPAVHHDDVHVPEALAQAEAGPGEDWPDPTLFLLPRASWCCQGAPEGGSCSSASHRITQPSLQGLDLQV